MLDFSVVVEQVLGAELNLAKITRVLKVFGPGMNLIVVLLDPLQRGPVFVRLIRSHCTPRIGAVVSAV